MSYVRFKIEGLNGVLDLLHSLPAEVVSKRGGPVKQSLRKGALILRDQERLNLSKVLSLKGHSTGLLLKHVIASRGKAPTEGKGERYVVRIKKVFYPRDGDGKKTTTLKTAHILEYGSEKQKPTPFIRPAFMAKKEEVLRVVPADLVKRVNAIVRKLAKQNSRR